MGAALARCVASSSEHESVDDNDFEPNPSNPVASFSVVGGVTGVFTAEIFLDRVPLTASNFIDLAQSGFYDGLHFHRVIPDFMNQFGCPHSKDPANQLAGTGNPPDGEFKNLKTGAMEKRTNGGNIVDEHVSEDSNEKGSLSMANSGAGNTGGSQFFLNVADNDFLDWFSDGPDKHPVFGHITSGLDLIVRISKVKTVDDRIDDDADRRPLVPIKVESVVISNL
mmetsp:Transcript_54816/g.108853  ORF Transcript_54816/g.108853 Transcript_54816/m.108853 type:complete len:224 (-) Transcript_54816:166-837(-)